MKALKIGILMFGLLAIVSCKDANKGTVENDEYAIDSPDYNNDMNDLNDNTDANIDNEGVVIVEDEYMVYSTEHMQEMYKKLDMTQEQINKFESDFHKKMDDMSKDTTISMDKDKLRPEMDNTLKAILTSEQYKNYEQWKMDNSNL